MGMGPKDADEYSLECKSYSRHNAARMEKVYAIISLLGAVPGLLLSGVIWRGGAKHPPNRILALGLVAYCSLLLAHFLFPWGVVQDPKRALLVTNALVHVSWPAFYLYLRALTSCPPLKRGKKRFHALPAALYCAVFVIPALAGVEPFQPLYVAAMAYTGVITLVYSVGMLLSLVLYQRSIENFFSELTRLRLTWIRTNIALWLVVVFVQILFSSIQSLGVVIPDPVLFVHGVFISLITSVWVYVIAYYAIVHPDIFLMTHQMTRELAPQKEEEVLAPPEALVEEGSTPPDEPTADEEDVSEGERQIVERLHALMGDEKPYLDDQLTIAKLAKRLRVPAYALGRIINRRLDKNFMTFVNEHRIEEVKRRLTEAKGTDEKIIDIAFESGFRTKSAFNAAFKKATGMTPSQYRDRV